ncbi:hypothetical protein [Lactococcus lactis]|uniref:Uncharacterized protein n=1 Tax=Lactococcus lactis TaxID=1358 RepID=A0AAW8UDR0_9LACT|nr:hypothetical protein [Lactococcus lactis]MDT2882030.1 hypothetical protein [Lactococcus lactis]MDT2946812.1 hypothetical protein [Lactococcus lactis]MDT2947631.1 hypothetical protein [Lactococcus lactis]
MTFQVKTVFPKEETAENNKFIERTFNELVEGIELDEVVTLYEQLLNKGYSINVNFAPPQLDNKGTEPDPFMIANRLELAGISYKATLKLKASGDYESMVKIAKLIEQQDYDYDITAKLQIRENSTVDFEKESSWFDKDYTKYTILPKASSQDIADLRTLYDDLIEMNQKVTINIKAKVKKDDDDAFATQLASYPEDTLVIFKLSDAEIHGD